MVEVRKLGKGREVEVGERGPERGWATLSNGLIGVIIILKITKNKVLNVLKPFFSQNTL